MSVEAGGQFKVDAGGSSTGAVQSAGNIVINGLHTGNVQLAGGELNGPGVLVGTLSGAGLVGPGNSPGILDAVQIDPTSGLDFLFQFGLANSAPSYLNRTVSGTDANGADFYDLVRYAAFEYLLNGIALDMNAWHVGIDTVPQSNVDYGGVVTNGRVMRLQLSQVQAVPEPSSILLCSLATGGFYWRCRKGKRTTATYKRTDHLEIQFDR